MNQKELDNLIARCDELVAEQYLQSCKLAPQIKQFALDMADEFKTSFTKEPERAEIFQAISEVSDTAMLISLLDEKKFHESQLSKQMQYRDFYACTIKYFCIVHLVNSDAKLELSRPNFDDISLALQFEWDNCKLTFNVSPEDQYLNEFDTAFVLSSVETEGNLFSELLNPSSKKYPIHNIDDNFSNTFGHKQVFQLVSNEDFDKLTAIQRIDLIGTKHAMTSMLNAYLEAKYFENAACFQEVVPLLNRYIEKNVVKHASDMSLFFIPDEHTFDIDNSMRMFKNLDDIALTLLPRSEVNDMQFRSINFRCNLHGKALQLFDEVDLPRALYALTESVDIEFLDSAHTSIAKMLNKYAGEVEDIRSSLKLARSIDDSIFTDLLNDYAEPQSQSQSEIVFENSI